MDMMAPRRCNRFRRSYWDIENDRRVMIEMQPRIHRLADGDEPTNNDPNQKHAFLHYLTASDLS